MSENEPIGRESITKDGIFAVQTALLLCLICMIAGAFATWAWIHGTHECSASVRYEHVTVEYVTECRL